MAISYNKSTRSFATYGDGPHHCIVCIKSPKGEWSHVIEEGDYKTVKELYSRMKKSDQTIKVFKLD